MRKTFASEQAALAYIKANPILANTPFQCKVVMSRDCRFAIALIKGTQFLGFVQEMQEQGGVGFHGEVRGIRQVQ